MGKIYRLGNFVLLFIFFLTPEFCFSASNHQCIQKKGDDLVSALEIYDSIRQLGERRTLQELRKNMPKWHTFISGISCGDQAWVEVGVLLVPHATGTRKHEIRMALEEALIQSPEGVLMAVSGNPTGFRMACGPSAHETYDLAESSLSERQSAVMSLHQSEINRTHAVPDKVIDKCLELLEEAERKLTKN